MEHRQFILLRKFIDKIIAEQSLTFEKASELCSVGTSHCLEGAMQIIFAIATVITVTIGQWLGMSEFDE